MSAPLVTATIAAATALVTWLLSSWLSGRRERLSRRREQFAKAYSAVVSYEEFPYVVRRRGRVDPEAERLRISTEMRRVQEEIAFHSAWVLTEDRRVSESYRRLVSETRRTAGGLVREAWDRDPIASDAEMNILDIGPILSGLEPQKDAYLQEVKDHMSFWPRWFLCAARALRRLSSVIRQPGASKVVLSWVVRRPPRH